MIARLVTAAPALVFAAALVVAGIWAVVHSIRAGRRLPAAPDNRQGTDSEALWTCRHILRQPLIDPDIARRTNQYLRQKGDETP
ncbi:hypothetical protein ACFWIO_35020 [Streptomyces diastatochromogenes]|uniref:hypothetical protein n=1 Tax=Streptomyces diastatochromogenes TaxID=42236 RepID=UPI0036613D37